MPTDSRRRPRSLERAASARHIGTFDVQISAPKPAYVVGMDLTVTLVVSGYLAGFGGGWQELRHPGMTDTQCKALVKEIERPFVKGYCFVEGRPAPVWSDDGDYTLTVYRYVGGGRTETSRTPKLNKSLCKAWAAEETQAGNSAYCDPPRSSCPDCPTIRDLIRVDRRAPG
jgi:hypothetical protein